MPDVTLCFYAEKEVAGEHRRDKNVSATTGRVKTAQGVARGSSRFRGANLSAGLPE
jgi:hypothetical protein